jgi:poly(3-hydroxybutyrate) depolymerase
VTEVALENQGGSVYSFGGDSSGAILDEVWRYDPQKNVWTPAGRLTTRRAGACAVRVGTTIYVIGGHDGNTALTSVETFDTKTGAIGPAPSLSAARNHAAAAIEDGKIYVFGGTAQVTSMITSALSSAERLDPTTPSWAPLHDLPGPRWGQMGTSAAGKIWLAGGHDAGLAGSAARCELLAYDAATDSYAAMAPPRIRRHGGVAFPCDGKIFLVGGTYTILSWQPAPITSVAPADSQWETSLVEAYDIATGTWSARSTMLTARTMLGGTMADGFGYLVGGQSLDLAQGVNDDPPGSGGEASFANGPVPQGSRTLTGAFERFDPLTPVSTVTPAGTNGSGGTLQPGEHDVTITSSGQPRVYRVYIPAGFTNASPRPLVLMVHGTSDLIAEMDLARFEEQADRDQVLLVKPQGVVTYGPDHVPIYSYPYPQIILSLWPLGLTPVPGETHVPSYPQYLIGGPATTWEMHDWQPDVNLDLRFLLDLIADVGAKWNVDSKRIYQFGQSNGALFTSTAGTHHGELYAACCSIAGGDIVAAFAGSSQGFLGLSGWPRGFGPQGPSPDLVTGRRTPFLFLHGTGDTVVPPAGSISLHASMLANGWQENDAQLHLLPNGGHVWFTLNEEIWSFFLARSLP